MNNSSELNNSAPRGLQNYGATCWFNALMQCLKASSDFSNIEKKDTPLQKEFLNFMKKENSDPRPFLSEFIKKFPSWQGLPNDCQEALLLLMDVLNLTDFIGKVTQTITYPDGTSVTEYPCSIFLNNDQLILSDYKDDTGKVHKVAIQETHLTTVPKILVVSDLKNKVSENMFGKKLFALIPWCHGHYIAFVRGEDNNEVVGNNKVVGNWHMCDDDSISNASPNMDQNYYLAFYK